LRQSIALLGWDADGVAQVALSPSPGPVAKLHHYLGSVRTDVGVDLLVMCFSKLVYFGLMTCIPAL